MELSPLPPTASWIHDHVRSGFEVLFVDVVADGRRLRGSTSAREGSSTWCVGYRIDLDPQWQTTRVQAVNSTSSGDREVTLERHAGNRWTVNGEPRPDLDGCSDVDFESSAVTNTLPVHRLPFVVGEPVEAPAAYVRAEDLAVERIEQRYTLISSTADDHVFDYESPTFDFRCELTFDPSGLVRRYPGIATRDH